MTVRAILDTKGHQIQSVEPETKLSAAIKILAEKKIGAVLAMSSGRIEGILSERDIVRVLGERGASVLDEPVSAVMTRKVISCKQSDTVSAIMEMMTLGKFRHLPVVEDGKETKEFDGRRYLLERALHGDVALVRAHKADRFGNLRFWRTARNFNPVMATAAKLTLAEVRTVTDELLPRERIQLSGVYVDRVVAV